MIERNRNPAGRISNMIFGLCAVGDGLVRFLSLGHLHTRFCLEYSKRQAKKQIRKVKERRPHA